MEYLSTFNSLAPRSKRPRASSAEIEEQPPKKRRISETSIAKRKRTRPRTPSSRRKTNVLKCITQPLAQRLPPELLHEIFERALPPDFLLDPSLHHGPNSAWCASMRTKRALISVCRSWYTAGVDLLYRTIALRRMPDIPRLLAALEGKPWLGSLIRDVTVMCYVPPTYRQGCDRDIAHVFTLCPNVVRLSHIPPVADLRTPTPIVPPTVTSLTLGQNVPLSAVHAVLQQCSAQLHHLALHVEDNAALDAHPLPFPLLESLALTLQGSLVPPTTKTKSTFSTRWAMPRLVRLSFRLCPGITLAGPHALAAAYHHFLSLHGGWLRVLAFPGMYPAFADTHARGVDYAPLLRLCGSTLQHLVLPEEHYYKFNSDLESPGILRDVRWLDLWAGNTNNNSDLRASLGISAGMAFRMLDPALISHICDPWAFHPAVRGSWALAFPGLSLRQEDDISGTDLGVPIGATRIRFCNFEDAGWDRQSGSDGEYLRSRDRTRVRLATGRMRVLALSSSARARERTGEYARWIFHPKRALEHRAHYGWKTHRADKILELVAAGV
ncbi:hypothetical protein B0H11DRAFT_2049063 [Mycena galericulata]|nr:hypothetical protein B0H11DRAFT_2049063 [Mycena galericulata]